MRWANLVYKLPVPTASFFTIEDGILAHLPILRRLVYCFQLTNIGDLRVSRMPIRLASIYFVPIVLIAPYRRACTERLLALTCKKYSAATSNGTLAVCIFQVSRPQIVAK